MEKGQEEALVNCFQLHHAASGIALYLYLRKWMKLIKGFLYVI